MCITFFENENMTHGWTEWDRGGRASGGLLFEIQIKID